MIVINARRTEERGCLGEVTLCGVFLEGSSEVVAFVRRPEW